MPVDRPSDAHALDQRTSLAGRRMTGVSRGFDQFSRTRSVFDRPRLAQRREAALE